MTNKPTGPIVAKSVRLTPIVHESYSGRRTAWAVAITWLDGTESLCHTGHGHQTKQAAKACVTRELRRRSKAAENARENEMTETKAAADLVPGDIVHYNGDVSWRMVAVETETDKTVTWWFTYERCEFSPSRVGTDGFWRFRKGTKVRIN